MKHYFMVLMRSKAFHILQQYSISATCSIRRLTSQICRLFLLPSVPLSFPSSPVPPPRSVNNHHFIQQSKSPTVSSFSPRYSLNNRSSYLLILLYLLFIYLQYIIDIFMRHFIYQLLFVIISLILNI